VPPTTEAGEYFTSEARRSAISAALPLVGTYFQNGGRLDASTSTLAAGTDEEGELVEALRLRVALAAAVRLSKVVDQALARPNFRYGTRHEEVTGAIRGRLDLQRLIRSTGHFDVPPRFPVRTVERQYTTPENTLLACALLWVRRELRLPVIRRLGARSAELVESGSATARIDRALSRPELRDCQLQAIERLERGQLSLLCDEVERRLAAGHVTVAAYRELVEWVRRCLAGSPAAEPGEIEWSFYGSEFDTRLFEIWLLVELRARLLAAAGVGPLQWDFFADGSPIDVTSASGARLRLVSQTSMRKLRGANMPLRWRRHSDGTVLGEIPDYLIAQDDGTSQRTVVVDAKLRQRESPTEEVYKLLGYFNHYGLDANGRGAIVYYAANPSSVDLRDYRSTGTGRVLAFSVDPERPEANTEGWEALLELLEV